MQGAAAFTSSAHLSLQLSVQGLGPRFKLLITLRNDGATHVRDVPLLLVYNEGLYTTPRRHLMIPLLVPTISYTLEVGVNKCGVCEVKRARVVGRGNGDRSRLQHHPGRHVMLLFMVFNVSEVGRTKCGESVGETRNLGSQRRVG